jgi:hypothetical protein
MTEFFKNLAAIRLSLEAQGFAGHEVVTVVHTRKPPPQAFIRVHPDPEMSVTTALFFDKHDRNEAYFVPPGMRDALMGELTTTSLVRAITRQGGEFIWPLPVPGDGIRRNAWHESAWEAAELAKNAWVRVSADMALGAYRVLRAVGDLPEPTWSDKPLEELLEMAFRGRVIDAEDHPLVRRLRGAA